MNKRENIRKIKKLISMLLIFAMIFSLVACSSDKKEEQEQNTPVDLVGTMSSDENYSVNLYYYSVEFRDYLAGVVELLKEVYPNITVTLKYSDPNSYIEKLVSANGDDSSLADVYLLSSSELEKAYMAGMTTENNSKEYTAENFAQRSLDSASYNGKLVSYPICFSTQVMLVNEAFETGVPGSFEEIKEISSNLEVAEGQMVENILAWDLSDMKLNYAFLGKSMMVGGANGDDATVMSISNENVLSNLQYFKDLTIFFNITRENISSEKVIESFSGGRTIFALTNVKDILQVDSAMEQNEGTEVDYTVARIPDIDESTATSALSETVCAVVNPYSKSKHAASAIAEYLSYNCEISCFESTGYFPARILDNSDDYKYKGVYDAYNSSVIKCRMMDIADFYTRLDIALHNIADGEDMSTVMGTLDEYIKKLFE